MHLGTKTEVEYIKYLNRRIKCVKNVRRKMKIGLELKFINDGKLAALLEVKAELIKMIQQRRAYYVDK